MALFIGNTSQDVEKQNPNDVAPTPVRVDDGGGYSTSSTNKNFVASGQLLEFPKNIIGRGK